MAKILAAEPFTVNGNGEQTRETLHSCLYDAKADKELGWSPTLNLEEGLGKTVVYLREKELVA